MLLESPSVQSRNAPPLVQCILQLKLSNYWLTFFLEFKSDHLGLEGSPGASDPCDRSYAVFVDGHRQRTALPFSDQCGIGFRSATRRESGTRAPEEQKRSRCTTGRQAAKDPHEVRSRNPHRLPQREVFWIAINYWRPCARYCLASVTNHSNIFHRSRCVRSFPASRRISRSKPPSNAIRARACSGPPD